MPSSRLVSVAAALMTLSGTAALGDDLSELQRAFRTPPPSYHTAPLWVWNDQLRDEHIVRSLRMLASQRILQAFVHPRPGLVTPYLSKTWFHLWHTTLREARRLNMRIWIYDENSYPSGFAGGLVPEAMPEARGQGLFFEYHPKRPPRTGQLLATFPAQAQYLVARLRPAPQSRWFAGYWYVDLLKPGVTEKFLELTLDAYARELGNALGDLVPGVFSDEAHIAPAGGLPWTDDLPEQFRHRRGYELIRHLAALHQRVGDWKRVRHDYYRTLLELFIERWCMPYAARCDRYGLEWTGHYWEHEWPRAQRVPDNMAVYAWHHRPGIDILMNRYDESVHSQFGNVRSVLEVASVAHQRGRKRTLCEIFGAAGWDLRLVDMKRIADWAMALGINTLDEHLTFISIRGARKRDHPQSFSDHEPWWPAYGVLEHYFARLCLVLSQGTRPSEVLLLEPTTTLWMYQGEAELEAKGQQFQTLVTQLAQAQIEFDLGSEDVLSRWGRVRRDQLLVGAAAYRVVVLPPEVENLERSTFELLKAFVSGGGELILCQPVALERINGVVDSELMAWRREADARTISADQLPSLLSELTKPSLRVTTDGRGIVYHQRRVLPNGQFLFLVNSSLREAARIEISAQAQAVSNWDPFTGDVTPYPFTAEGSRLRCRVELPPAGSRLLFFKTQPPSGTPAPEPSWQPVGEVAIRTATPTEPNVLVLDYVDLHIGARRHQGVYFHEAARRVFRAVGLEGNPWERAIQLHDRLLRLKLPASSPFRAQYSFDIDGPVPEDLSVVVERPDLYEAILVNGRPVKPTERRWLDRSFRVLPIAKLAREGRNTVALVASRTTVFHELEPVYVLGRFGLRPQTAGFVIQQAQPLQLGPWADQGMPFYGHGVRYEGWFDVPRAGSRYAIRLGRWDGSVAELRVNGAFAGYVLCPPWQCEVTEFVRPGRNRLELIVYGTLRNTLGPHHAGPVRGSAWPAMFLRAPDHGPPPGAAYDVLDYGLFEPPQLVRATRQ